MWGTGLLIFLSWLLVVLCDPFMKEDREEAFSVIVVLISLQIILWIWRRLVMAKR